MSDTPDPALTEPTTIYQLLDALDHLSPEERASILSDPALAATVEAAAYEREMDKAQWPELYATDEAGR